MQASVVDDNGIKYIAREDGPEGNGITIDIVPGSTSGVVVAGNAITVTLEDEQEIATSAITSGADEITLTAAAEGEAGNGIIVNLVKRDTLSSLPLSSVANQQAGEITVYLEIDGTTDVLANFTTALGGSNDDLAFTSKLAGPIGNTIQISYVEPVEATSETTALIVGNRIVQISLAATGSPGSYTITATAADVKAAIEANFETNNLVTVANAAANDGTGVVTTTSFTLANGTYADAVSTVQEVIDEINGNTDNDFIVASLTDGDGTEVIESSSIATTSGGITIIPKNGNIAGLINQDTEASLLVYADVYPNISGGRVVYTGFPVTLAGGAASPEEDATAILVSIGDSIMSDVGHGFWLDTVRRSPLYRSADFHELGVSGRLISDLAANIVEELSDIADGTTVRPLYVCLGTGINDLNASAPPATVFADLQTCIAAVHAKNGIAIVFNASYESAIVREYNSLIKSAYDLGEIDVLVDLYGLKFQTWDGLHPNEFGGVTIARECIRSLGGNPTAFPHEGVLPVKTALAITAISAAASAEITAAGHGLTTGGLVHLTGTDSTPIIDGVYPVTVTGSDTFTVPVTTTVAGAAGAVNKGVLRMFGGGDIHAKQTVQIDCKNGSGASVETFFGTQCFAYSDKLKFDLHSIAYLPSDGASVTTPIFEGVAMLESGVINTVTCYLVNKSTDFPYDIIWDSRTRFSRTDASVD